MPLNFGRKPEINLREKAVTVAEGEEDFFFFSFENLVKTASLGWGGGGFLTLNFFACNFEEGTAATHLEMCSC